MNQVLVHQNKMNKEILVNKLYKKYITIGGKAL